jgi:hypothetical protein
MIVLVASCSLVSRVIACVGCCGWQLAVVGKVRLGVRFDMMLYETTLMTHGYKPPLHKKIMGALFYRQDTWVSVEFGTTSTAGLEMLIY